MIRKIFLWLSLLTLLVATGCWARSYFVHEVFPDQGRLKVRMVVDTHGPVRITDHTGQLAPLSEGLARFRISSQFVSIFDLSNDERKIAAWIPSRKGPWFSFHDWRNNPTKKEVYVCASLGPMCSLLSVCLILAFVRGPVRRWRRRRRGLCLKCEYDLTGNVSDVCPECGEPVAPS